MNLGGVLRRLSWPLVALTLPLVFWACNNLLGIDAGRLACVHTSECPESQICLYERCSPECEGDRDCPDGEVCTQTEFEPHCVRESALACESDAECSAGAQCDPGVGCRYPCSTSSQCVSGQSCEAGLCVTPASASSGGEAGAPGVDAGSNGSVGGMGGMGGAGATTSVGGSGGTMGVAGVGNGGSSDTSGSGGTSSPEPCGEGTLRCPLQAATSREVCRGGGWEATTPCDSGTLCDSQAAGACVEITEQCLGQSAGTAFCEGATRLVCGNDLANVTSETCDSAAHCVQATGPECAVCLSGEFNCDGEVLEQCRDDRSGFDPLRTCNDAPCNALLGECTDRVCDADAYYCDVDSNTLSQCNSQGTDFLTPAVDCGTGICDREHAQCDVCEPEDVLGCEDNERREVCNDDGQGTSLVWCAEVDPETPICVGEGQCVECIPLSAECLDEHQIKRCSAEGRWELPQTCMNQACVDDSCVGVCSPGTTDCADDSNVATCDADGTYGAPVSCSGKACVGTSCTGSCEPTTTECADKFSWKECTSEGSWDDEISCTGQACVDGDCVGTCVPETKRCNNGEVETCSDQGGWADPLVCIHQTCVEAGDTASCQGECAPDEQRCNDNKVQNCNALGAYSGTVADCTSAGQTCVESGTTASCQGACAPGDQRCNDNNVQNCSASGAFSGTASNCTTAGATCVELGDTAICQGTCSPGDQRCNNNNVQECNATGAYSGTATNCTTLGETCVESGDAASCTGDCVEGRQQCASNTPQYCDDVGSWQDEATTCDSPDFICELAGSDAECVSNPEYSLGYSEQFAATSSVGLNFMAGNPLVIDRKVRVLEFGLIAAAQSACRVHMLLYTDRGGSPGERVGFSAEATPPNISAGRHELAPSGQIVIDPGTYWLMAHYNCAATILAFDDPSAPTLKYAVVAYGSAPDPFPTTGVTTITTFAVNHYLNVQNAP